MFSIKDFGRNVQDDSKKKRQVRNTEYEKKIPRKFDKRVFLYTLVFMDAVTG